MRSSHVGWFLALVGSICATSCAKVGAAVSGDAGRAPDRADAASGDLASFPHEPPGQSGVEHVLLLSIDGLHTQDLVRYISEAPNSTLAQLAATGTRYDNARAPFPSDSFPSVLAWATGGTPRSTGVFYDISYDRSLSAPGTDCSQRGARVDFSDDVDLDNSRADGGGGLDPKRLPRDPEHDCTPVYPHNYLHVNTIFEVVKAAGKRTAWSDKHLSYEVSHGPSGDGVDDLFDPEIASVDTKSPSNVVAYDDGKVEAILHQLNGQDLHHPDARPVKENSDRWCAEHLGAMHSDPGEGFIRVARPEQPFLERGSPLLHPARDEFGPQHAPASLLGSLMKTCAAAS